MISFLLSIVALILGYFVYGKFVAKVFGVDANKPTPAMEMADGVDYMPIDWKRGILIQFLNIAGLGPIFGAVAGAYWGPAAFIWIVLGSIFAGATHDFFAGMLSVRHKGATVAEIIGIYLGTTAKNAMRIFSVLLLLLVGVVFIYGPAGILENMTGIPKFAWLAFIIMYYLLATVLPIDMMSPRPGPRSAKISELERSCSTRILLIRTGRGTPSANCVTGRWKFVRRMASRLLRVLAVTTAISTISGTLILTAGEKLKSFSAARSGDFCRI